MAFNFEAGLSSLGESVAKTAGAWTLEAQRAELQKEAMALADQMASVRDEKQRGFLTGEREATQKFTSGEKALDRTSEEKRTSMSSGASLEAARIHARSIEKQIDAENNRATVLQPNADMTVSLVNKVTGKVTPLLGADDKPIKVRDPDLAKAQYEAVRAVENDKKEIRLKYQTDLSLAQSELNKILQNPMATQDETLKKPIEAARKYIDEITQKRDAELAPYNERSRQLIDALTRNIDIGAAPDLTKYLAKPTSATPSGLIESIPGNL